jgi:WD40 repeat protein
LKTTWLVSVFSLLLVAVMAALAAWAYLEYRAAEKSRKTAEKAEARAKAQKNRAQKALKETQRTLSQSDFFEALRLIDDGKDPEALAQLARSLSFDRNNRASLCRLVMLLTYRNWAIPALSVQHDGPVPAAQFSPDAKSIVTGSWDKTARIWDSFTGKPLTEPIKHKDSVWTSWRLCSKREFVGDHSIF